MAIRLSKEWGVNPSVTCCQCCGKEYGIALFGSTYIDPETGKHTEAPHKVYTGFCDECKSVVNKGGILVIEVQDGTDPNNPYRTGRYVGCNNRVKQILNTESDMAYMEHTLFEKMFRGYFNKDDGRTEEEKTPDVSEL